MSAVRLPDAELWAMYWRKVGLPEDDCGALEWWKNPGPLPEGFSAVAFLNRAPDAVRRIVQERGLPFYWLDAKNPSLRYEAS